MIEQATQHIVLKNRCSEITRLGNLLAEFGEKYKLSSTIVYQLDLILDELVTNIISYGYPASEEHEILVTIRIVPPHYLEVELIDEGIAFNPLEAKAPDILASVEERPIGGLGIHLTRHFTEKLFYKRHDDKNHLKMLINLKQKLTPPALP